MKSTQFVAAGLLSAAIFLSSSAVTLADKGGKPHGGAGAGAPGASAPGNSGNQGHGQGPFGSPSGSKDKNDHSANMRNGGASPDGSQLGRGEVEVNGDKVTVNNGNGTQTFTIANDAVRKALLAHQGKKAILYSLDGKTVTSVGEPNELVIAKVDKLDKDAIIVRLSDGQQRVVHMSTVAIAKMHLRSGSSLALKTNNDGQRVLIGDLDGMRGHGFATADSTKFDRIKKSDFERNKRSAKKNKTDKDVADKDVANVDGSKPGCGKGGKRSGNPAFANQMAKDAANDASGHNPPGLPHECVNPAGHTRGFCKQGSGESICGSGVGGGSDLGFSNSDRDKNNSDLDKSKKHKGKTDKDNGNNAVAVAEGGKCGKGSKRGTNPAFANQMAKDAANDASGHNPPGLPHECVNPAGHTRGFCKQGGSSADCSGNIGGGNDTNVASDSGNKNCVKGSSKNGRNNPAFVNQMAKDAANDASGHNPPGLPHECVNPAGHTRGFCKSRGTESSGLCSASVAVSGSTPVSAQRSNGSPVAAAPVPGFRQPVNGNRPVVGGPSYNQPGAGIPVASNAPTGTVYPVGPARAKRNGHRNHYLNPTSSRVLGAATGPVAMASRSRHPRVLGMTAVVGSTKPCIWRKSTVAAAVYHPHIVPTVYVAGGRPIHHKKCVTKR